MIIVVTLTWFLDSADDTAVKVASPRLPSSAGNLPYDEPWFHGKISRQEVAVFFLFA